MQIITTQRPAPYEPCTEPEAYKEPMMNMVITWPIPPTMVLVLRPHLSAKIKPTKVARKIRSAEIPEARNDAVEEVSPAVWKRTGAY